jgi:hypothetical protein
MLIHPRRCAPPPPAGDIKRKSVSLLVAGMILVHLCIAQQIPKFNSNSAASATVYLDFDGQAVKGTAWNWDGTIQAKPANLSSPVITEIFNRTAEDFRIFNLNVTTDSSVFKRAPATKRMRVIITPTYTWYGDAAGVSFINSFTWGDDTPAWVFSSLLENKAKYIAEAVSHEIGHTLGLQHQSTYSRDCELIDEYAEGKGSGEIGWAPIMGVGYYKNLTLWTIGPSIEGCSVTQNDISIISKGFNEIGLRKDEHGDSRDKATSIIIAENNFAVNGLINHSGDRDFFKITLPRRMKLSAKIIPNNVSSNNSGANVDLFLTLIKHIGDTIGRYNPKALLNASADTVLAAGTYYLGVDGSGNQNVSDYGSVGLYALSGSLENISVAPTVLLRGDKRRNNNIINWSIESGPQVRTTYIEYSLDGRFYTPFKDVAENATTYVHQVQGNSLVHYRVRVQMTDESTEYSNVVVLANEWSDKVKLQSNMVQSMVAVRTAGEYAYQLFDETGRLLAKGNLASGVNEVPVRTVKQGLVILKVFNQNEQYHFRIIKQ